MCKKRSHKPLHKSLKFKRKMDDIIVIQNREVHAVAHQASFGSQQLHLQKIYHFLRTRRKIITANKLIWADAIRLAVAHIYLSVANVFGLPLICRQFSRNIVLGRSIIFLAIPRTMLQFLLMLLCESEVKIFGHTLFRPLLARNGVRNICIGNI